MDWIINTSICSLFASHSCQKKNSYFLQIKQLILKFKLMRMCCTHLNYLMLETHIVVSGDANFSMKQTSLTVGGSINPCATYLN